MQRLLYASLLVLPGLMLACVAVYAPRHHVTFVLQPDAPEPPPELEDWCRTPPGGQ